MTEQGLNMTKVQAPFKKVSGKAVAKGVDMDFFLIPHSSTTQRTRNYAGQYGDVVHKSLGRVVSCR